MGLSSILSLYYNKIVKYIEFQQELHSSSGHFTLGPNEDKLSIFTTAKSWFLNNANLARRIII